MSFDLANFLNILISCLLGATFSWVIAHLYWKKNAPTDRIVKELKQALPAYLNPIAYPQFYSSSVRTVNLQSDKPADNDIPHVTEAIFSKMDIARGDRVEVLLTLVDMGRNLDNPAGVTVWDHNNEKIPVRFCGLGLAAFEFKADLKAEENTNAVADENSVADSGAKNGTLNGDCKITIDLMDTAGKTKTQTLSFRITK